uniref:Apolipoprotein L n=1 Tax=Lates calcarifer TaxID=8187 RepID=A0A4W6E2I6_LATCA
MPGEIHNLVQHIPHGNIKILTRWALILLLLFIRMDSDFRTVFMFQEVPCSRFSSEFNERKPRMLEFLDVLEECAVQLDRMSKGAKIARVASSTVGAVGSVLSIVGLALIPVTAGASLALTMTGLGLGIAHGLNSAVIMATKIGVKRKQQKKAEEVFKSFMKDVQSLQDCLKEVTSQSVINMGANKLDVALGVVSILTNIGFIVKNIESIVESAASDVPQVAALIGEAAANAGSIAVSAVSLAINILSICKNGRNLAKDAKSEAAQSIRATAELCRSEMDSLEKICQSLHQGLPTSEKNKAILDRPFYPEKVIKEERDTDHLVELIRYHLSSPLVLNIDYRVWKTRFEFASDPPSPVLKKILASEYTWYTLC